MSARHSPGPFEIGTGPHGITLYDVASRVVATVPAPECRSADLRHGSPHTLSANAANVRLLRASPDMRALLAALVGTTFSEDEDGTGTDVRNLCKRIAHFKRAARVVLAYVDTGDIDHLTVQHTLASVRS